MSVILSNFASNIRDNGLLDDKKTATFQFINNNTTMAEALDIKELDQVVVRFSGDSGDGMQLAGNIFSTVSATVGNSISTFPDYPADIRAPQGSLTGVSGSHRCWTGIYPR